MMTENKPLIMRLNREAKPITLVISEQGENPQEVVYTFEDDSGLTREAQRVVSLADSQIMHDMPNDVEIEKSLKKGTWVVFDTSIELLKQNHN